MRAHPLPLYPVLLALLLALLPLPLGAQDEEPPVATPEEVTPAPRGETTVYVPYEKLVEVFEREGRGVFLPYEEFLRLWKAAGETPPVPPEPPVPYILRAMTYTGRAQERTATFTVELQVQTLRKGWVEVPLAFGSAALREITLGGAPAHVTPTGQGIALVVPEAGEHTIQLELDVEVAAKPGEKRIAFAGPRGAVTRLDLTLPDADVEVEVEPTVAETTTPAEGGGTQVLAFLAATQGGEIVVTWHPRRAEAATQGHRFGEVAAQLWIEEGLVRYRAGIDYTLIQTDASEFQFSLPKEMVVLGVTGESLRDWVPLDASPDPGRTVYRASLYEPARDRYRLEVRAERSLENNPRTVGMPDLRLEDVAREKGTIGVGGSSALALSVAGREDLVQINPGDLPESTRQQVTLAFRYLRHPYRLQLGLARVEPRVTASVLTTVSLRREGVVEARSTVNLTVKKAGIFEVRLGLPAGLELREVGPDQLIDDYRVTGEGADRVLEVSLAQQTIGTVQLVLTMETFRPEVVGDLAVPMPDVKEVERETGVVGIAADASLKVTTLTISGLTPVDVQELPGAGVTPVRPREEPLLFGYRYHARPVSASIQVTRKSPKVTAQLATRVNASGNAVRYHTTIDFQVEFSGVSTFTVEMPGGFGDDVSFEGEGVKTRTRQPATEDGAPDVWVIETQSPRLGSWRLGISYDRDLPEVRAGQEVSFQVPVLRVRDVERQTGHIAVLKEENLEVSAEPSEQLEAIDPRNLPGVLRGSGVFLAYRYLDPGYTLSVSVTRHEYEAVLTALVEGLVTRSVVSDTGEGNHVCALEVRNASEQFLRVRLPGQARLLSAMVNGKEEMLQSSGDLYLVQLPVAGVEQTVIVRLLYTDRCPEFTSHGEFLLRPPVLVTPDGQGTVPVTRQRYELFLPREYEYYDFGSEMTEQVSYTGMWQYIRGILRALIPTLGAHRGASGPDGGRLDRLLGQLEGTGEISPEIQRTMRRFVFDRLHGGGQLEVEYISRGAFYARCLVLLLLGLVGGYLFWRLTELRRRHVVAVLIFVPMLLGPFFSPTGAMLLGCLSLAGLILLVIWVPGKISHDRYLAREARRRARALPEAAIASEEPAPGASETTTPGDGDDGTTDEGQTS